MTLPSISELTDVMAALTLRPIEADRPPGANELVVPSSNGLDETGNLERNLGLGLTYSPDSKLTIERFLERVSRELTSKRHDAGPSFALLVLAISLLRPGSSGSDRLDNLNQTIASTSDADLKLYFVSNVSIPATYAYELPPYRFGPLRSDKLRWNSEKAGSPDFYLRYAGRLVGKWTIEREPNKVATLDIPALRQSIFGGTKFSLGWREAAWVSLVTAYFSQHNRSQFLSMWDELVEAQDTLVAMGAPYLDPRSFTSALGGMQIATFRRVGSRGAGFVAPATSGIIGLDLANAHVRIPKAIAELRDAFEFSTFDGSPLHETIRLFASFVARARRHDMDGRSSDALLHFVIALELAFGERQNIQKSVSERVAAITSKGRAERYAAERKRIDGLYESRSRYVHSGEALSNADLVSDAFAVCGDCFRSLLSLQAALKEPGQRDEGAREGWLVELDYLAKGMIAGKTPTPAQLAEAHILYSQISNP